MKNEDHSFTLLAVLIIAGVIAACLPDRSSTSDDTALTLSKSSVHVATSSAPFAPKS